MPTAAELAEQQRQFEEKHALELKKFELDKARFERANDMPWYRANLPWLGPTLGALVAFFSLLYSNNVEQNRQITQRAIEANRLEEENIRQAQAQKFQRETQIILQATRSADPEVTQRNLEFFLKANFIEKTNELKAALDEIGSPTETGPVIQVVSQQGKCNADSAVVPKQIKISEHAIDGILICDTPNKSATPLVSGKPRFVIVDYTGGPTLKGSVNVMMNSSRRASAHILIGRDGRIVQLGKFNEKLWHAGSSRWKGINGLNSYSVGIELVNFGWLRRSGDDYVAWSGTKILKSDVSSGQLKTDGKERHWQKFTKAQLNVLDSLVKAISKEYKIPPENILGQYEISPGRKHGPGPLLDLVALRKSISK